jgi:hypothetical protein
MSEDDEAPVRPAATPPFRDGTARARLAQIILVVNALLAIALSVLVGVDRVYGVEIGESD